MRAFFFGAGASKQDRFPLTWELKHGIAWAIHTHAKRFSNLLTHLQHIYNVDDEALAASVRYWEALRPPSSICVPPPESGLPDVTDWLSTLDWMIREQSSFGPGRDTAGASQLSLLAQLTEVRDLVIQALCVSLARYEGDAPPSFESATTTHRFMKRVAPDDLLVTTNWDLLLDAARDDRFGTSQEDYGTVGSNVRLEHVRASPEPVRPRLLKLHGSLSWRYCPRCQRLVIDPRNHVAGERQHDATCECRYPYSELIVTPGFVREYRNVHLLTIWREALFALAFADEWVFVGYSLPPDDVGIRALLLRARCIREDVSKSHPAVTVVTGPKDREAVGVRFRSILPTAQVFDGDFLQYVEARMAVV